MNQDQRASRLEKEIHELRESVNILFQMLLNRYDLPSGEAVDVMELKDKGRIKKERRVRETLRPACRLANVMTCK